MAHRAGGQRGVRRGVRRTVRYFHRLDELAGLEPVAHVVEVEVVQRDRAPRRPAPQHQPGVQRHQHRRAVADGRAVGQVAGQRARMAHWRSGKAQVDLAQRRPARGDRAPGVFQRHGRADVQRAGAAARVYPGALPQVPRLAQVEDVAEVAELLGHPQPDVGGAGQQACLRPLGAQRGQRRGVARRVEAVDAPAGRRVGRGVAQRRVGLQRAQPGLDRRGVQPARRQLEHALPGLEDGAVAGAAAQVARQVVGQLLARGPRAGLLVLLVGGGQGHHEARGAEAALRAVAVDHGLLHRVRRVGAAQVLHRQQRLAVQRGQEADAAVDRPQPQAAHAHAGGGAGRGRGLKAAVGRGGRRRRFGQFGDDHGAGAAVAFAAAFLRAGAAGVLAQPVEHGAGRGGVAHLAHLPPVHEADRACVHARKIGHGAGRGMRLGRRQR